MIGLGVVLITAALVIVYSSHPNRDNPIDKAIADYFFNIDNSTLETIMEVITYLGESIIYIGVLLILYYAWDKKKSYRAIFLLISSTVINVSSKAAFSLDRPNTSLGYADPGEPSYGLPSGHAQISSTFWGVLTSFITKWGMITVAIILPLLINAILSHNCSTTFILWLVRIIVLFIFFNLFIIKETAFTSNPKVGSSKNNIFRFNNRVLHNASFIFIPLEKFSTY